ncbi:MAG: hypothetical protein ACT4NV_02250 [Rhodoferax sp.]
MMEWWSADAAARMPDPVWAGLWLRAGWGVVLAALGWGLAGRVRCAPAVRAVLAGALALSCALPGGWAPSFWLGLVWQGPSAALVLWAAAAVIAPPWAARAGQAAAPWGAVLGAVLLLDSFALWPLFLYPWGFSPWAVLLLALALGLPWVVWGKAWRAAPAMALALGALLWFALTGLPSGNAWDALLDMPLWALCCWALARRAWRRGRSLPPT